jgi:hypothetical protein
MAWRIVETKYISILEKQKKKKLTIGPTACVTIPSMVSIVVVAMVKWQSRQSRQSMENGVGGKKNL